MLVNGYEVEKVSIPECRRRGLGVTNKHNGKMRDNASVSSSARLNDNCTLRSESKNPKCICTKCYANKMARMYKNLEKMLERNTELLTTEILDFIPDFSNRIKYPYERLEAFGDVGNTIQQMNYFNIVAGNPDQTITQWTKNPAIIAETMTRYGVEKPKNMIIVYSSPIIDHPVSLAKIQKIFPFVDKVFTVWSSEEAARKAGHTINCGKRHCMTCLTCYKLDTDNEINELLK